MSFTSRTLARAARPEQCPARSARYDETCDVSTPDRAFVFATALCTLSCGGLAPPTAPKPEPADARVKALADAF